MIFRIFYYKPDFSRDACMGHNWLVRTNRVPTPETLDHTHTELKTVRADDIEDVFMSMQGEHWFSEEARELLRSKGLDHASMSVGDILIDENNQAFMVDRIGFVHLPGVFGKKNVQVIEEEPGGLVLVVYENSYAEFNNRAAAEVYANTLAIAAGVEWETSY